MRQEGLYAARVYGVGGEGKGGYEDKGEEAGGNEGGL